MYSGGGGGVVSTLWHNFVSGGNALEGLDPVIGRSWQRCRKKDLDFQYVDDTILTAHELRERYEAQDDLLQAGKNVLPFLVRYLKGQKYIVLLCDAEGYILKALGHPPFLQKTQAVHLSPGANWREDVKGTNAIGTALQENTLVTVLGWEHYVKENQFLNCWASPIRNTRGELVGVLDISGESGRPDDKLKEIVLMGARMIEQNLQVLELQNSFRFCREGIKLASEMLREGFVTINERGEIMDINNAGVKLLGGRREDLLGRLAADVFSTGHNSLSLLQNQDIRLSKPGNALKSNFRQVQDENGDFLGAVGLLQPTAHAAAVREESLWVGRSERTRKLFRQAAKAASTVSTVLIQGESGTGKEVVARYIHRLSERSSGAFVALNCAAIPETLIESELFGYVDGAFTGARRGGQQGKFELAQNGTIFLDEIGDMPLHVQASLLRVLQEREIYRIGDAKTRKVNARVVAATNQDIKQLVDEGKFRLDLYYRLKVVTLDVPPLRERAEDILDLVPHFLKKACAEQRREQPIVTDEVYSRLLAYSWPGNIRELENCVESMLAMAEGLDLTEADLPDEVLGDHGCSESDNHGSLLDCKTRQAIMQALSKTNGKVAPAARMLGIGRTTLYRKMEEFNIKP